MCFPGRLAPGMALASGSRGPGEPESTMLSRSERALRMQGSLACCGTGSHDPRRVRNATTLCFPGRLALGMALASGSGEPGEPENTMLSRSERALRMQLMWDSLSRSKACSERDNIVFSGPPGSRHGSSQWLGRARRTGKHHAVAFRARSAHARILGLLWNRFSRSKA